MKGIKVLKKTNKKGIYAYKRIYAEHTMKNLLIIFCMLLVACGGETVNNYIQNTQEQYGVYKKYRSECLNDRLDSELILYPAKNGDFIVIDNDAFLCSETCVNGDYRFDIHMEGFIIVTNNTNNCEMSYVNMELIQ